ncbi:hypothetical protein GCM10011320_27960 [Neoroseomonas lacus]|uniref:Uncharacterized protein n=1 Tax=Neoroseomonas lacus TaxID=287609 RepID=A0A917KMG8_9PROT|nr:hypothetical protein GCM10011320_27960 [Neoroseomonas lacus]
MFIHQQRLRAAGGRGARGFDAGLAGADHHMVEIPVKREGLAGNRGRIGCCHTARIGERLAPVIGAMQARQAIEEDVIASLPLDGPRPVGRDPVPP